MKIKEIIDLGFKDEWNQFVTENSSPADFLQSWQWGEFKNSQQPTANNQQPKPSSGTASAWTPRAAATPV